MKAIVCERKCNEAAGGRVVCGAGGCGEGVMQVEPHILLREERWGWRLSGVRLVGVRGKSVCKNERESER